MLEKSSQFGDTLSPREQAAFAAGIECARQMALTTAVTIEVRNDAGNLRQRAAAAALQGLADGLKTTFIDAAPLASEGDVESVVVKL